jgi:hypothetical protein
VTLHMVSRPVASRAELTCTSYTVSNEERSLSPVGGAITADYWVDPSAPRYFWYAWMWPFDTHAEMEALLYSVHTSLDYPQWVYTVLFLPQALRLGTRTVFSFQGTRCIFFSERTKAVIQGLKPQSPYNCRSNGVACGGLKPSSVKGILRLPSPNTSFGVVLLPPLFFSHGICYA